MSILTAKGPASGRDRNQSTPSASTSYLVPNGMELRSGMSTSSASSLDFTVVAAYLHPREFSVQHFNTSTPTSVGVVVGAIMACAAVW